MTKRILFIILLLFESALAFSKTNVDSLFLSFEGKIGGDRNEIGLQLVQYFIQDDQFQYPIEITESTPKTHIEAAAYLGMAYHELQLNDFQKSIEYALMATQQITEDDPETRHFLANCYEILSNAYFKMGRYSASLKYARKSRSIGLEIQNENLISNALASFAGIYLATGKLQQAERYAKEAIEIELLHPNDDKLATLYGLASNIILYENRIQEAQTYLNKALQVDQKAQHHDHTANRILQKGNILKKLEDWPSCIDNYQKALAIFRKTDNAISVAYTLKQLGCVEQTLHHNNKAEQYFLESEKICQQIHSRHILQLVCYNLYKLYKDSDPAKALSYFEKSSALKDSLLLDERELIVNEFEIKYNTQGKETELALIQNKSLHQRYAIGVLISIIILISIILLCLLISTRIRKKRAIQLAELNKTKGQYFSIISHDLKNPMAAQKHMINIVSDNFDKIPPTELKQYLIELQKSTNSMNDLLFDLLQWSSLDCGRMEYIPTRLNIRTSVESAIRKVHSQAESKKITITHNINEDILVYEDINFTEFIIRNLLSNAIKFSPENSNIEISLNKTNNNHQLSIIDHGIGMTQEQITESFQLGTKSRLGTNGERGTGLGLLVCKDMIEKGGNRIFIHSILGEGTTVTFTLKAENPEHRKNKLYSKKED